MSKLEELLKEIEKDKELLTCGADKGDLMLQGLKVANAHLDFILSGEWRENEQGRAKKTGTTRSE